MPLPIQFIGLSFAVIDSKVCAITSSEGDALYDLNGLSSAGVLAFIWSLKTQNSKLKTVFTGFDFATDLEVLFQDLSSEQKDIFFLLIAQREEELGEHLLAQVPETQIEHAGFKISSLPGKLLRLAIPKRSGLSIYDIGSYFEGCDVSEAMAQYCPKLAPIERVEKNLLPLWKEGLINEIVKRAVTEAGAVAALAERVQSVVNGFDLNPRAWYGPSAIAAHCLNRWGARKQARRLKESNSPHELIKAIDVAYIGGRVEMVKLGTIPDVRTFDLNSAYAYAITLLSQFYNPLRFTRKYDPGCPFACWLVSYELPDDVAIGILPMRSPRGGISFPSRGKGYFWQPEVDYLQQRYPDCLSVQWGYVTPEYRPVTFATEIQKMYDYRMVLKEQGDAGQKIIKLALSNLYGKFAQNKGTAFYQCRAWAGWITSFVRRLMLEAITGIEDRVICFCQDAIHVTGTEAAVPIGSGLGEWKRQEFAEGLYVSPGLYELRSEKSVKGKTATRGSNMDIDFQKMASELSQFHGTELSRSFFVGWQMARNNNLKYGPGYLQETVESLTVVPSKLKARNYKAEFDWSTESRDSTISKRFSGLLSSPYRPNDSQSASLRLRLKDRGWV